MIIQSAYGFRLMEVNHPLELCDLPALEPATDEVIVAVAGCGVCHTDVGYAYDGVQTRHALPLILGHEITGRVAAAGDKAAHWDAPSLFQLSLPAVSALHAVQALRPSAGDNLCRATMATEVLLRMCAFLCAGFAEFLTACLLA
jgi:hypothetical protein